MFRRLHSLKQVNQAVMLRPLHSYAQHASCHRYSVRVMVESPSA